MKQTIIFIEKIMSQENKILAAENRLNGVRDFPMKFFNEVKKRKALSEFNSISLTPGGSLKKRLAEDNRRDNFAKVSIKSLYFQVYF